MKRGFLAWSSPGLDGGCLRGSLVPSKPQPSWGTATRGRPASRAGAEVGGRRDAGPKRGAGPPSALPSWARPLPRPRAANRDPLAPASPLPRTSWCLTVPLPSPLRPTSEEALKWGESLEKLLLHKCKWGPAGLLPSLCDLPPTPAAHSSPPLPDLESVSGPRQVAFPPFLGAVRYPRCWERPRPLGWPWSRLLPAPPCPWELALPARGHWDLCAQADSWNNNKHFHVPRAPTGPDVPRVPWAGSPLILTGLQHIDS